MEGTHPVLAEDYGPPQLPVAAQRLAQVVEVLRRLRRQVLAEVASGLLHLIFAAA